MDSLHYGLSLVSPWASQADNADTTEGESSWLWWMPSFSLWSEGSIAPKQPSEQEEVFDGPAEGLAARLPLVHFYDGNESSRQEVKLEVDSLSAHSVDNEYFRGQVLFLHRPNPEPAWAWPYSEHFKGKLRRFEIRCQGVFKVDPGDLFFAAVFHQEPLLTWLTRSIADWIVSICYMLSAAKGLWFHYSLEQVPQPDGSVLRAHYAIPMLAAEALVVTPPGETPPSIVAGHFPESPMTEKLQDVHLVCYNLRCRAPPDGASPHAESNKRVVMGMRLQSARHAREALGADGAASGGHGRRGPRWRLPRCLAWCRGRGQS